VARALGWLASLAEFVPGRIGRWLRAPLFVARLGLRLRWLRL
jgi:hypothetical protein